MKAPLSSQVLTWARKYLQGRDPLPAPVRQCLANPAATARLHGLILRLSGYHNLTNDQRRERALSLGRAALAEEGIELGGHDLSLVVGLIYARVKEETPFLIAPPPRSF